MYKRRRTHHSLLLIRRNTLSILGTVQQSQTSPLIVPFSFTINKMHLSFSIVLSLFLAAFATALAMPAAKEGIEARKNACNFRLCEDCYLRCKAKEW